MEDYMLAIFRQIGENAARRVPITLISVVRFWVGFLEPQAEA